jgi:ferredoxin
MATFSIGRYRDCKKQVVHHIEGPIQHRPRLQTMLRLFGAVRWYDFGQRILVKMDVPHRFHLSAALGGPEGIKVVFREGRTDTLLPLVMRAVQLADGCTACGDCLPACPEGALSLHDGALQVSAACTHCLDCLPVCPLPLPVPEIEDEDDEDEGA